MKNKKAFLFIFIVFVFMLFPKNVFASVTNVNYYDSNYTLISGISNNSCNTTDINNPRSNVRYIRFVVSDTLQPNTTYSFIGNVGLSSLGDYAWVYWGNGNSGINYNGGYVIQTPSSARTVNQSVVVGPPSLYGKSSTFQFNFTTSSSTSSLPTFFQLDLGSARSMVSACLNEYQFSASNSSSSNQDIINNNNYNTSSIINNDNNNTQNIINNQNENTDKQIESQKVCKTTNVNKDKIVSSGYLYSNGSLISSNDYGVTDYISIFSDSIITVTKVQTSVASTCFYDNSKSLISCITNSNQPIGNLSIPSGARFVRFSIYKPTDIPNFTVKSCTNGNQALSDDINDLNNNINNDNTDGATANANANITDFDIDNHGLADIFNTLTTFIANIASSTCSTLSFTLPFVHNEVTLPCMSTVYNRFPTFFTLYQLITTGLIAYRVSINLFQKVKQLSDPNYDKIEVVQL